jgi:hypothetical protein
VAAILAADASSLTAASEATGIPRKTIAYWMDRPEFAELRQNAREGMAEDALMVARLDRRRRAGRPRPRDRHGHGNRQEPAPQRRGYQQDGSP